MVESLILIFGLLSLKQPAFARDLILHDMHNGDTMARGKGILSVHDELERLDPGVEVQAAGRSRPSANFYVGRGPG